jgi:hypothetical protein
MKKGQRLGLLLVGIGICFILGVYYLVPGVWHPLTFSGSPTGSHLTHALLFFGLAVLGLISARFVARS